MLIFIVVAVAVLALFMLELAAWALVLGLVGVIGLIAWAALGPDASATIVLFILIAGAAFAAIKIGFGIIQRRDDKQVSKIRAGEALPKAEARPIRGAIVGLETRVTEQPWMPPGVMPSDVIVVVGVVGLIALTIVSRL